MTSPIADSLKIAFEHREAHLVIGLTGRTGSGCSTAAEVLGRERFVDLGLPPPIFPPGDHEDRKHRIVSNWLTHHWHGFQRIQVSHVIALFALRGGYADFSAFAKQIDPQASLAQAQAEIETALEAIGTVDKVIAGPARVTKAEIEAAYRFLFEALPAISARIKSALPSGTYTKIFQSLGDNIRRSGLPFSDIPAPSNIYVLPETISRIVKIGRLHNKIVGSPWQYFVIDALRHPFEIRYLRERIPQFYVFAVTTDEMSRVARLVDANYTKKEIAELDKKEYPEQNDSLKHLDAFVSQNIQACLEIADVYVSNHGTPDKEDIAPLATQIARYVALMQHPGLVTPTRTERCMHTAFTAKLNSGCVSRQVGAVVTDANFSIKAIGWNDVPRGQVPCILRNSSHVLRKSDETAYSDYEIRDEKFREQLTKSPLGALGVEQVGGRNITFCFKSEYNKLKKDKNQVHTRSLHAEENAFLQIAKYGGTGIEGGCLFTTASPCELCAKKAYQLGISKIYYIDPYPGISNEHILRSGTKRPDVHLFHGAIGRAYHDLYQPIMAYKDELKAMLE